MRSSWKLNNLTKKITKELETHVNLEQTIQYLAEEQKNQIYLLKKQKLNNIEEEFKNNTNLEQIQELKKKQNIITIWLPQLYITHDCIGTYFSIYNGKIFTKLLVTKAMVGNTFGNFIFTRKLGKKKKK
jgi:ribosomal protein S19